MASLTAQEGHRLQADETVYFSEFMVAMNSQSGADTSRSDHDASEESTTKVSEPL